MARGGGVSTGAGGGGYLAGADPRGYNPASGGIPGVTNPLSTVLGNLGGLGGLIGGLTGASSAALRAQYPAEYFGTLGTLLGNVGRRAAGDISDLLPELQTHAAERAVAGGVSGSGAANTKLLRDLGLTRYGVESQALKDLSTIQGEIPQVHPFDPSATIGALINAQERADLYRAAPVPEAAYQRAMSNVGGGGGGYGGGGPATYRPPMGGGGGSVDDILARFGQHVGYGPPIFARGTREGPESELINERGIPLWALNPENLDLGGGGGTEGGGPLADVGDESFDRNYLAEQGDDELYRGYTGPDQTESPFSDEEKLYYS